MKKLHSLSVAAICALSVAAFSLPAQAGQSEEQRYIIRKAIEAKQEKARQAAQLKREELQKQAGECIRPEQSQAEAPNNAS